MRTLQDLREELDRISGQLTRIIKASGYEEWGDISGLEHDPEDPESLFLKDELEDALEMLDKANSGIKALSQPIAVQGQLHRGSNGRYFVEGRELSSGYGLEVLAPTEVATKSGDWRAGFKWVATRMEHNGEDYYIVGYRDLPLEGLTVRIRERG